MKGITLLLSGKYGHFKRPEMSNSPCTYSFMHKCAFMGLMGAVLGIERTQMLEIAPQLYDDLLYGIRVLKPIIKEPVGFTKRKVPSRMFFQPGRRFQEVLKNPSYEIILGLVNNRSEKLFDEFLELLQSSKSRYPTYFGIVSCPCDFKNAKRVNISDKKSGETTLSTIFSSDHEFFINEGEDVELIFERVPTHQIDRFYTESRIVNTICPPVPVRIKGDYYIVDGRTTVWMM